MVPITVRKLTHPDVFDLKYFFMFSKNIEIDILNRFARNVQPCFFLEKMRNQFAV